MQKPKPFKEGTATTPSSTYHGRRGGPSLSTLFLSSLLLVFILSIAYASVAVYRWAEGAVQLLPNAATVDLPAVVVPAGDAEPQPLSVDGQPQAIAPKTTTGIDLQLPLTEVGDKDRLTVLLLGVDQRPDDPSPPRTDNMIVVTADLKTGRVGMISLPRDLFVPIPGFDRSGKINTAFVVGESNHYPGGGGALAKKTVSDLLGYPIDYYVKINFDGFVRIVDMIGGIDIDVPKTIHDDQYPTIDYGYTTFHIEAGPQHLDGETALKYARTRHADDDFQRAKRQQQVLLAIKDKVIATKLLTTLKIFDLLDALADTVEHDIPPSELVEMVALAGRLQLTEIDQLVLDNHYGKISTDSPFGWILVPDRDKLRPAVDRIFAAATAAPEVNREALANIQAQHQADLSRQQVRNSYAAQAENLRSQLASEGARIALQDGTGDATIAARAAEWLRSQGYTIVETGAADRTDYARTQLHVYADKPVTVAQLRNSFGVAQDNVLQETDGNAAVDVRVVIGRDFYLLVSN